MQNIWLFQALLSILIIFNRPSSAASCPTGWKLYNQYCYRLGKSSLTDTYVKAVKSCQSAGAKLASIHSLAENNFVSNLAWSKSCTVNAKLWRPGQTLIGGVYDSTTNKVTRWSDGTAVNYTNLASKFWITSVSGGGLVKGGGNVVFMAANDCGDKFSRQWLSIGPSHDGIPQFSQCDLCSFCDTAIKSSSRVKSSKILRIGWKQVLKLSFQFYLILFEYLDFLKNPKVDKMLFYGLGVMAAIFIAFFSKSLFESFFD
ncbi:unnamed protein product, partial [Mesorhabditis belari]|uniref:C-type lectin domain-containing protein n=1 Tax=Mesorhabditis belari TaxID=2138241 RepID=A0AAF3EJK8_9BILA